MTKAYLSSTLNDLGPERDAVKAALAGRYTVVESYDADESSLRDSCLKDVATCELYVGIVGLRYGFIPLDEDKSITELEFEAAKGMKRLVFLKSEDEILAKMSDAHTGENGGAKKIREFRDRLTSGKTGIPRPAVFSDAADLKDKLFRALSPHNGVQPPPHDPAPEGKTELQRMLAAHLNRRWTALWSTRAFRDATVFLDRDAPPTARPDRVAPLTARIAYEVCVCETPVPVLIKLREFVGKRDSGSALAELAGNADLLEAFLLMTLVAAECYVTAKVGPLAVQASEPIGGDDPRIAAVLAAACYGFGLRLSPSRHEPRNFVRPAAEELGFEQGRDLVRLDLLASANRLTLENPPEISSSDVPEDEVLRALLDYVATDVLGCRLVVVTHSESALREPHVRSSALGTLDVPVVFEGVPRDAVKTVLSSLKALISPLIDGALGPLANDNADTTGAPTTESKNPRSNR